MALHDGRFLRPIHGSLAEDTIRNTFSFVASTSQKHDRLNPTIDANGELSLLLSCLFQAFVNEDPLPIKQKPLPLEYFKKFPN